MGDRLSSDHTSMTRTLLEPLDSLRQDDISCYHQIHTDIKLFSDSQRSLLPKIARIFQLVITPCGVTLVSTPEGCNGRIHPELILAASEFTAETSARTKPTWLKLL